MNAELLAVAKHLNDRGFLAEVVDTPEQAKQRILEYIGDRSVGIAGSATVRDLGLYEALTERGNTVYWHWKVESRRSKRRGSRRSPRTSTCARPTPSPRTDA